MPTVTKVKRPWMVSTPAPKKQTGRKRANKDIYSSSRWTKASAEHRRKSPYCVECLKQKKFTDCSPGTKAGVTDHIIPINKGGDPWDPANFQTLCNRHANQKNVRDRMRDR